MDVPSRHPGGGPSTTEPATRSLQSKSFSDLLKPGNDGDGDFPADESLLNYDSDSSGTRRDDHSDQSGSSTSGPVQPMVQTGSNPASPSVSGNLTTPATKDIIEPMAINNITGEKNTSMLDPVYYQCKSARLSTETEKIVIFTFDSSFCVTVVSQCPSVGTFESYEGLEKTFHGSRFLRGGTTVNQSISVSFDPSKLACVSCNMDHSILENTPIVLLFSDQNFVPSLTCTVPKKNVLTLCRSRIV
jgi:hypothetical protein